MKTNYEISTCLASELLKSKEDLVAIENFTFDTFVKFNPHVENAYRGSNAPDQFASLFKMQIQVGLEQIRATEDMANRNGVVVIARDKSGMVVGFVMGIRGDLQLHSNEYLGEVFGSTCGMSESLNTAFGPVMSTYDLGKIKKHTNLMMIGMTGVHPDHLHQGIAMQMCSCLQEELAKSGYDGCYTIATSNLAEALCNKLSPKSYYFKSLLKTEAINFLGFAFNKNGEASLRDIHVNCRSNQAGLVVAAKDDRKVNPGSNDEHTNESSRGLNL